MCSGKNQDSVNLRKEERIFGRQWILSATTHFTGKIVGLRERGSWPEVTVLRERKRDGT